MDDSDEPFGPYDFPQLLTAFEHLLDRHTVAIVGGQALNVWATYYDDQVHDELAWFAPYTSKDIDCYGNLEAAQALADVFAGEVYAPHPDDQTPNTAVAVVVLNGRRRAIDFLGALAGVPNNVIRGDLATVDLAWPVSDDSDVRVRLLHPLPILMSRAGNIVRLRRDDDRSVRQMRASIIVLRAYLNDRLNIVIDNNETDAERADAHREVVDIAKALLTWAGRNLAALGIYERGLGDPLAALSALLDHPGWDRRFRERELKVRFERVVQRRETRRVEAGRKQAGRPT